MNKPKWYLGFIWIVAVILPAAAIAAYLSWSRWSFVGIYIASAILIIAAWIGGLFLRSSRRP